jgi:hypothetical protein
MMHEDIAVGLLTFFIVCFGLFVADGVRRYKEL